ncbi:MAG: DUF1902 domain-containing protein [Pseudomonadales bacterium]|jgi:hypothetical protein|nr:DUF1902 domain-containing protein [Pseudomonadales bacterium]
MERVIKVIAVWDDEAQVWVAHSRDVHGLAIEAPTQEELGRKLAVVVPELIELNGLADDRHVPIELLIRGQRRISAAC